MVGAGQSQALQHDIETINRPSLLFGGGRGASRQDGCFNGTVESSFDVVEKSCLWFFLSHVTLHLMTALTLTRAIMWYSRREKFLIVTIWRVRKVKRISVTYSMPKCRVIHQTQWSSFHIPLISPSYLISTLPFLWHLYSPHTYTTASTFGLLASKKKPPQTQGPNQQGSKTPRIAVLYPSSLIGRAWRLAPEPNLLAVIQSKTGDQSFDTSPTNGRA